VSLRTPVRSNLGQRSQIIKIPITSSDMILKFEILQSILDCYLYLKVQKETKTKVEQRCIELLKQASSDNPLDKVKNTNNELVVIRLKDPSQEVNVPN